MAGYSGTPLARKLGIGAGSRIYVSGAPGHYPSLVAPLPDGVRWLRRPGRQLDLVHVFVTRRAELERALARFSPLIRPDGAIWVSWPKKASKVRSEVTEDTVRELALPRGLVDVKVCAVDEVWSGLKVVVRKELRAGWPGAR